MTGRTRPFEKESPKNGSALAANNGATISAAPPTPRGEHSSGGRQRLGTSYDANGNLLNDSFYTYTWDAENRPVTTAGITLVYDALGRLVEQQNSLWEGNVEQAYAPTGQKFAIMNGQSVVQAYVQLPAGIIAKYTSSGLDSYWHPDWLGSVRMSSTPTMTSAGSSAYAPFGEQYAKQASAPSAFTGQEQDMEFGLYDFLYREYHGGAQGRWISPDPAGLAAVDFSNPQSWNRYAYVMNNPTNDIDPFGLQNTKLYVPPPDPFSGWTPFSFIGGAQTNLVQGGVSNDLTETQSDHAIDGDWLDAAYSASNAVLSGGSISFFLQTTGSSFVFLNLGGLERPGSSSGNGGNVATISAVHGYEGSKKQFCDRQSNLAAADTVLPGVAHALQGDYRPIAATGVTFLAETLVTDAASGTSALYTFRSWTGIPMSVTAKFLKYFGYASAAFTGYSAMKAMQKEYKACME